MKSFKVMVEYDGRDKIYIKGDRNMIAVLDACETMDNIIKAVGRLITKSTIGIDDNAIADDLELLGYDGLSLFDYVCGIDGIEWNLYSTLYVIKHNDYESLRMIASTLLSVTGKHAEIITAMATLYKQTDLAFLLMLKSILPNSDEETKMEKLASTYLATTISDNIEMFKHLELGEIPIKNIDDCFISAAKNNACDVLYALLHTQQKPSGNGITRAIEEANVNNNSTIVDMLMDYALTV